MTNEQEIISIIGSAVKESSGQFNAPPWEIYWQDLGADALKALHQAGYEIIKNNEV